MESIELTALTKEISSCVDSYSEAVIQKISARLEETADQILDYIKSNSPRTPWSKKHLGTAILSHAIQVTVCSM